MKQAAAGLALLAWAAAAAASPALTATETRWLRGMAPVIAEAQAEGLPLDIVVQPQPTPGLAPLALAWVEGRCKLVLSMRGHDAAEATLGRLQPDIETAALELMAAHELGHCHRHVHGAWQAAGPVQDDAAQMQAVRREEAYGDLVGLAWIQARRPARYAALHAWLLQERQREQQPGGHHDTLPWLVLAADPRVLGGPGSIYERAHRLWRAGAERAAADSVDLGAR